MLEFLYRVQRIQLQAHVIHVTGKDYTFPRYERRRQRGKEIKDILCADNLPTENEMFVSVSRSRKDAVRLSTSLGMILRNADNISSPLVDFKLKDKTETECYTDDAENVPTDDEVVVSTEDEISTEIEEEVEEDLSLMLSSQRTKEEVEEPLLPNGPFVHYNDENGRKIIIRKSTLCWIYSNNINKLSNERLERVKGTLITKVKSIDNDSEKECSNDVVQLEVIYNGQ